MKPGNYIKAILSLLLSISWQFNYSQLPAALLTPELVSINRMPMKANAFAFESMQMASGFNKEKSANYFSLNGNWKFDWVQDPDKRPKNFFDLNYNDDQWKTFRIPASWEVNGYGLPIYVNQPYDFAGHNLRYGKMNPPYDIPANNNPVGSYRKKIVLPQGFKGKQIFLHVGNAKSCLFVWVNGKSVGYSEDSKLAAEFDITEYVQDGENLIAFQVYRWSDASYLECQDMFRFSGIERDVYIYVTNKLNIRDAKIDATLDETFTNGLLHVNAEINNYKWDKGVHSKKDSFMVELSLQNAGGKEIYHDQTKSFQTVLGRYKAHVKFSTTITDVKAWNAETPYLYMLYLTLKDKNGQILEVIPQRIGFKKVAIKGADFLVNGKRVLIKGVNRHEHHPRNGHALTKADMLKDIEMMKKLNINAVRHSHYPPDPYWLELCDEYGLYVVDEANIESHGLGYDLNITLGNKPRWREAHLQRIQRMYERDKNHTAVVTWSLGNEAGDGSNFYEAYEWLKSQTMLPVQYERTIQYGKPYDPSYSDVYCPQYFSPSSMENYIKSDANVPFIQSEYAHIMGNSLGNFKDYWDIIENESKVQGGFIWEWLDQNIDTVKNGRRIKAYGGDFPLEGPVDENLSDNNFCVKGVVDAYRNITPMSLEVKKVYQHIRTNWMGNNSIRIKNGYFFRSLDNVQLHWVLQQNGEAIEKGIIPTLQLEAQQETTLTLPVKTKIKAEKEYQLNVYYALKSEEPFLPKDHEIATEQFVLNTLPALQNTVVIKGTLQLNETAKEYMISGKNFSVKFNKEKGLMTNYRYKGEELIQQGPVPAFWRAPTDNDIGSGFNKKLRMWRNAYDSGSNLSFSVIENSKNVCRIKISNELVNGDAQHIQTYSIYADGSIKVDNAFLALKGKHPLLLRAGNDLVITKSLNQINWYGRGPGENYWDRKSHTYIGKYQQTVDEQYYPYARPQESGNHTEVRWVSFSNTKGRKVHIAFADSLLSFSALPYSLDDLDPEMNKKQYHSGELNKRNETYVHIDLNQTGLQGIDSWGAWPMEKYRVPFNNYAYSYWIRFE